jgi:hypothetical protein
VGDGQQLSSNKADPGPLTFTWPEGKKFAFAIFDDTDLAVLDDAREIYAFLLDHGLRPTKSVWVFDGPGPQDGVTCEHAEYVQWLLRIREMGVEIAYHNASHSSSERDRTIAGLNRFAELFGTMPDSYACHAECRENIYWGGSRLSTPRYRALYNLLTGFHKARYFHGHVERSKWFWGDVCRENISYVRNFIFREIDTLHACPFMPYYDPARPFVNSWFASADGSDAQAFAERLHERNQDRLEEQGGACIMYTHTGKGFRHGGGLDPEFVRLIERISRKDGWFVPVSTLLGYLAAARGPHVISDAERESLEKTWLWDRMRIGTAAG